MLQNRFRNLSSPECLVAPRRALGNSQALREIGTAWLASVENARGVSDLFAALSSLRERLNGQRTSPLSDLLAQSDARLARTGVTTRSCLSARHEFDLVLEAIGFKDLSDDILPGSGARNISLSHRGEAGSATLRSVRDPLHTGWVLELSGFEGRGLRKLLADAELAGTSQAASRLLAGTLESFLANAPDMTLLDVDEIQLGHVTLAGPRALLSASSLISRALPYSSFSLYCPKPQTVADVAACFRAMRCEAKESGMAHTVSFGGVSVTARLTGDLVTLALAVRPREMMTSHRRPGFTATEAASELAAVLLVTGIADALPQMKAALSEAEVCRTKGNGYAQLSRLVCELGASRGAATLAELKKLNSFTDGTLPSTLRDFSRLCRSSAARELLSLLAGVLSPTPTAAGQPSFRCNPMRTVYSCEEAEGFFLYAVASGDFSLDPEFLHKHAGERTALTRVPMLIGGTQFPPGTLCRVEQKDGERLVTPGRLTAFALPAPEALEVFKDHVVKPALGQCGDPGVAVNRVRDLLTKTP